MKKGSNKRIITFNGFDSEGVGFFDAECIRRILQKKGFTTKLVKKSKKPQKPKETKYMIVAQIP